MTQEKENFLGRWSRLKQEAEKEKPVAQETEARAPELPPVDKLTPESEFTPFMHPKVEDALRRVALKKLFADPHFNTPDPFEPFSGDWTVGETISDEVLATLNQARTLLFADQDKDKQKEEEQPKLAEDQPKPDEPGKQDT